MKPRFLLRNVIAAYTAQHGAMHGEHGSGGIANEVRPRGPASSNVHPGGAAARSSRGREARVTGFARNDQRFSGEKAKAKLAARGTNECGGAGSTCVTRGGYKVRYLFY